MTISRGVHGYGLGVPVEPGQHEHETAHIFRGHSPLADRAIEHQLAGQTAHSDQPFHGLAITSEPQRSFRRSCQRHNIEIDIRREAPVEPHLFKAVGVTRLERAEVQKFVTNRFLQLVGMPVGEKDERHVRLDHFDRRGLLRVALETAEMSDFGLERHRVRLEPRAMRGLDHAGTGNHE